MREQSPPYGPPLTGHPLTCHCDVNTVVVPRPGPLQGTQDTQSSKAISTFASRTYSFGAERHILIIAE